MTFEPKLMIKVAATISAMTAGFIWTGGNSELAIGVLVLSAVLIANLWGWIWSIKVFIELVKTGGSSMLFTMFSTMKSILLITLLLASVYVFGAEAALISNTIIVSSLLCTTVLFAFAQHKGLSNGY